MTSVYIIFEEHKSGIFKRYLEDCLPLTCYGWNSNPLSCLHNNVGVVALKKSRKDFCFLSA